MAKTHEQYLSYMSEYNKRYRELNREKLIQYNRDWRKKQKGLQFNSEGKMNLQKLIDKRQQFLNNKAS